MVAAPCSGAVTPSADASGRTARGPASVQVEWLQREKSRTTGRQTTTARSPVRGTGPAGAHDTRGRHTDLSRPPGPRGVLVSVSGLVGVDDAGGDAAAVAHRVTVLARPVPDRAGLVAVHAATGGPATAAAGSTTGRTRATAHLAGSQDVTGEDVAHLLGVLVRQVDLVRGAVEGKGHGLVGRQVLVEVVAQDDLNLARHLCSSLVTAAREPNGICRPVGTTKPLQHIASPFRKPLPHGARWCEENRSVLLAATAK